MFRRLLVIPSLTRDTSLVQRTPDWPDWPPPRTRVSGALFEERPALRKLAVLADAELLAAVDDSTPSRTVLLTGLLAHPYIKALRYRDEGPPADMPRRSYGPPEAGLSVAEGWAELLPPDRGGVYGAQYVDGPSIQHKAVYGESAARARTIGSAAYRDRDWEAAADQRERDLLAAEVAQAVGADLFVTERPYLFELPAPVAQGVTVCRTAEALAVVSLYLRSQHEFVLWCAADGTSERANEWLYYQIGAAALLPESWRWSAGRTQAQSEEVREALSGLSEALRQRITRALRTRDSFHRVYSLPQNRDAVRTMLVELDELLVTLMGAVDVSARFVHILLGLPAKQQSQAGWQRLDGWLAKVAEKDTALAALFESGTPLAHTMNILVPLRNTIHSEAIRATMRQRGFTRDAPVKLPEKDEKRILDGMDALGGRQAWGAQTAPDKSTVVDPGRFVEQLFPKVMTLLNAVMEHTPGASGTKQRRSSSEEHPWYNERNELSIGWQLGFDQSVVLVPEAAN